MSYTTDFSHFIKHLDGGLAGMDLAVEGVTCPACMQKIENSLLKTPNITKARVNLTNRRLSVEWKEGAVEPNAVITQLAELGYRAYPFDPVRIDNIEEQESRFLLRCLAVAAFAAMNVMLLSVSVWSGNVTDITPEQRDFFHRLSALIALPAAAYAGQPFFKSAGRALAARSLNMDVPITLGVILALGMSVVETLNHAANAYFDSALMLLTFLLLGRVLEQNMRKKMRAVATNLAALKGEKASKIFDGGEIREVPVSAVNIGDLVLVRPGERLAVDGTVVDGTSEIDQSLVTGETAYSTAENGTDVYAGTMNVSGVLQVRVTATVKGTLLDEVKRLLDQAVTARSGYVQLADRAARLYSPVVHVTALATLIGWLALGATWHDAIVTAIAVLIITCPCALGLAIPAVQVVASGALFRSSVLLNTGNAIERLADVDTVIFDKTGTLTLPEPEVVNLADIPAEAFQLAGRLALTSRHPLAAAIARAAHAKVPLNGASEEPGQGVCVKLNGTEMRLGRPSFCGAEPEALQVARVEPEASLIAFLYGVHRYIFAVRQRIREDAVTAIRNLKSRGLAIEILSGDRLNAVEEVAHTLDVDMYKTALKPADKIDRIKELREAGRNVLMVGDGLNDAPALAAANVSMSPVNAIHLSQAIADAVFLGDHLAPITKAVDIGVKARRVMRQNLWLAVIYNAIAVPIAILGLVTPLIAALAMSGSSILVTANALRAGKIDRKLRRWRS